MGISLTLIISGSVMNLSVIAALLRPGKTAILNGFSLLVVHLAFADLMVFFTAAPFLLLSVKNQELAFTTAVCKATAFCNRFSTVSSIFILTVMAGFRFFSITRPFSYRIHVNARRINITCGISWVFSFVLSVTPFLGWGEYERIQGQCWCALDSAKYKLNFGIVLVLAFCIPTTLICYFLIRIGYALRYSRKTTTQKLKGGHEKAVEKPHQATPEVRNSNSSESMKHVQLNLCKADKSHLDRTLKRFEEDVDDFNEPKAIELSTINDSATIKPVITPSTSVAFTFRSSSKMSVSQSDTTNELSPSDNNQNLHQQKKHVALKNEPRKRHQNDNKTLYIVLFLFATYVAFCGPTYFVWTWYAFSDFLNSKPPRALFPIFRTMAGTQSLLNSLIYGMRHQDIRKEVFQLWKDIAVYTKAKALSFVHGILHSRDGS